MTKDNTVIADLQIIIAEAAEAVTQQRKEKKEIALSEKMKQAITQTINLLDQGQIRVAEKQGERWVTHAWIKQAILLYIQMMSLQCVRAGDLSFCDKVPMKFSSAHDEAYFANMQIRLVPGAIVRFGSYLSPRTVLMPSFVNIGAYVGSGSMVDTWATVGSCAQVGSNVHLSGGVGIGGVLEPIQNMPTIIEDNVFVGARSEVVEGVVVGQGAVIGTGVFISQSTPIYNRENKTINYGFVPPGAVVISGSLPSADGDYAKYAAIIVKQVTPETRKKITINELLRDFTEVK